MPRLLARFFSIVGHPMLVPTYALLLLLQLNPYAFGVHRMTDQKSFMLLLYVFITTALIPGIGIAVMKPLGFIKSLESPDRQERIGPYIITGIFYLWLYKNLAASGQAPQLFMAGLLGATISLFLAFLINIFTKISAHATGMGGLVGLLWVTSLEWREAYLGLHIFGGTLDLSMIVLLVFAVVFAGLVGMSRLVLKAHVPQDVWQGYAVGLLAMWAGRLLAAA